MNSGNAGYKLADMRDNEHLFALADGTADGYNHKIWADCIKCIHFPVCNEIALVYKLS